jgi:hypothetical protein
MQPSKTMVHKLTQSRKAAKIFEIKWRLGQFCTLRLNPAQRAPLLILAAADLPAQRIGVNLSP